MQKEVVLQLFSTCPHFFSSLVSRGSSKNLKDSSKRSKDQESNQTKQLVEEKFHQEQLDKSLRISEFSAQQIMKVDTGLKSWKRQ